MSIENEKGSENTMKMPIGPCLDCKDRTAENPEKGTEDCHRKCEVYARYREELDMYKRELNRKRYESHLGERPWMTRLYKGKVADPNHD